MSSDTRIWNAVHDAAVLEGKDPDEARRDADETVRVFRNGKSYDSEAARISRSKDRRRLARAAAAWSTVPLVLAGIGGGIFFIVNHYRNDYAGYGPQNVLGHAQAAVQSWYGANDAPNNLTVIRKEHARLYGQAAWKVLYRSNAGRKVCAWVWLDGKGVPGSGYGPDDYWLVREGAECS